MPVRSDVMTKTYPELHQVIRVRAENGMATVFVSANGIGASALRVVGASMSLGLQSGTSTDRVQSFSLDHTKDEKGVIALQISIAAKRNTYDISYLIETKRDADGKVLFELHNKKGLFVSSPGRLVQFFDDGRIEIVVDGVIYTNQLPQKSEWNSVYTLVDGDSLCRYAIELIDKEELEKRKKEIAVKISTEGHIRMLEDELASLREDIAVSGEEREELGMEIMFLQKENVELSEQIIYLQEENRELLSDSARVKRLEIELKRYRDMVEMLKISAFKDSIREKKFIFSGPLYKALGAFFTKTIPGHIDQ